MSDSEQGGVKTADEIEALLREEIRLQARLKAAGTSWLPDNAERMAQLRVLRAKQQWESLWS